MANAATSVWNSLEVVKLLVAALAPISVALLGWFISGQLKRLEDLQWKNRKVVEKRIEIFDRLAPDLNQLYCYFAWIGNWKELTPLKIIAIKRSLDHGFHVNRYIIGEEVFRSYDVFISLTFETFTGPNKDARIRTAITGPDGDRRSSSSYVWDNAWVERFTNKEIADRNSLHSSYAAVMKAFQRGIGL
jgi:hypothetical protein